MAETVTSTNPWRKKCTNGTWTVARQGRIAVLCENEQVAIWMEKALNDRLCMKHATAVMERILHDKMGMSVASIRHHVRQLMCHENAADEAKHG